MGFPRRDTKTLFPLHPLKIVLVSRPLAGLFSILHALALFPPRSVPNCKQIGIGKGGAVAPPNPFDQESRSCPIQGRANDGRGADAPYLKPVVDEGLVLARNAPSIVQPVCACQCIARPVPSALHIIPCPKLFMADRRWPRRPAAGRLLITWPPQGRRFPAIMRMAAVLPRRRHGRLHITLRGFCQEYRRRRRLAFKSLRELRPARATVLG